MAGTTRDRVFLFVCACVSGGFSAVLGSIVGAAFGKRALFVGGILGGLAGAAVSAAIARRWHWIHPEAGRSTAMGSAAGFLAAALVATQTLGSPVGPILSTALIGIGALIGAAWRRATV